jgi:hypothetical protein
MATLKHMPRDRVYLDTIQGRYPWKPEIRKDLVNDEQFYVAGNEGLAEVISLGAEIDSQDWKIGDWGWLFLLVISHIHRARSKANQQQILPCSNTYPFLMDIMKQ